MRRARRIEVIRRPAWCNAQLSEARPAPGENGVTLLAPPRGRPGGSGNIWSRGRVGNSGNSGTGGCSSVGAAAGMRNSSGKREAIPAVAATRQTRLQSTASPCTGCDHGHRRPSLSLSLKMLPHLLLFFTDSSDSLCRPACVSCTGTIRISWSFRRQVSEPCPALAGFPGEATEKRASSCRSGSKRWAANRP